MPRGPIGDDDTHAGAGLELEADTASYVAMDEIVRGPRI